MCARHRYLHVSVAGKMNENMREGGEREVGSGGLGAASKEQERVRKGKINGNYTREKRGPAPKKRSEHLSAFFFYFSFLCLSWVVIVLGEVATLCLFFSLTFAHMSTLA